MVGVFQLPCLTIYVSVRHTQHIHVYVLKEYIMQSYNCIDAVELSINCMQDFSVSNFNKNLIFPQLDKYISSVSLRGGVCMLANTIELI